MNCTGYKGRGSWQVLVKEDNSSAVTKWLDNNPVNFMYSIQADKTVDTCKRWCKKDKVYVTVPRPVIVNHIIRTWVGFNVADRLLAVCPHKYRTNKWTRRFISNIFDLATTIAWLHFKNDELEKDVTL